MKVGTFSFPVTSFGLPHMPAAGNVVLDVFEEEHGYSIIPMLTEAERRLTKIPAAMFFRVENGEPVSRRAEEDGLFGLLESVVRKLRDAKILQ